MEEPQTHLFRTLLLEQKAALTAPGNDHNASQLRQETEESPDLGEQASRTGGNLVELQLINDQANLLRKIDFALKRLDEGTYRTCTSCGNEIPLERLRAKPSASLCLACQEEKDHFPHPSA